MNDYRVAKFVLRMHTTLYLLEQTEELHEKDGERCNEAKEIDSLAKSSSNPAFRMAEFRVALAEYRKTGLRPKKKAGWTLDEAIAATRARLVSAVK